MIRELEDQIWWPSTLRNFQTDFVGALSVWLRVYEPLVKHLKKTGLAEGMVIDLCSGNGEVAQWVIHSISPGKKLLLTDKFPRRTRSSPHVMYVTLSRDALQMEFQPTGLYTLFNAFHHFSDADKRRLVERLRAQRCHAVIAEPLEPTVICFLKVLFATTIGCVLIAPFVQPFSLRRIFFTYVVPINILAVFTDGMISVFKSRSITQYKNMFSNSGSGIHVFGLGNCLNRLVVIEVNPDANNQRGMEFQQTAYHSGQHH